jgi:Ca2+-transporting ATPase
LNIFEGIHKNPYFLSIIVITLVLQAIIVQFGNVVFHIPNGGLDWAQWLICIGLGAGTWPMGVIVRLLPDINIPLPASWKKQAKEINEEETEDSNLVKAGDGSATIGAEPSKEGSPTRDVNGLWKKALGHTQMQIRVIKAFRDPLDARRHAGSPSFTRKSGDGIGSHAGLGERTSSSGQLFVNTVRGGRANVADYVALQMVDPNDARSKNK